MGTKTVSKIELHIGHRIADARLIAGFSQESLASLLNATPEHVRMYEKGEGLSLESLYRVARVLKLDLSYFYEGLSGAKPCPFALSDESYTLLKRTLQRIAADYEVTQSGDRKRLARDEAIRLARQVCETLGWDYSAASVSGGAK